MAIPTSVNLREDGDTDVLHMYTKSGGTISIAKCPDDGNVVSILCSEKCNFVHTTLTPKETELVVDALTKLLET